jgi:hypothetical protein
LLGLRQREGLGEAGDGQPGRVRLAEISDFSATSLHGFLADNLAKNVTAKTDGWAAYPGAKDIKNEPYARLCRLRPSPRHRTRPQTRNLQYVD